MEENAFDSQIVFPMYRSNESSINSQKFTSTFPTFTNIIQIATRQKKKKNYNEFAENLPKAADIRNEK